MNLYTLKSKVTIRIAGISGPFEEIKALHVNAPNLEIAKRKYESKISNDFLHMSYQSINFEYLEIIEEIK